MAVAQGLTAWIDLLAGYAGHPQACTILRAVCWVASSVALIEFGQTAQLTQQKWLLGHRAYAPLAGFAALSLLFGSLSWFDFEYRLVMAWQAGLIAGLTLWESTTKPEHALGTPVNVILGALLAYVVVACFQVPVIGVIPALVVGTACSILHRRQLADEGLAPWRQWISPVTFVLVVAAAGLLLPGVQAEALGFIAIIDAGSGAGDASGECLDTAGDMELSGDYEISSTTGLRSELHKCGLAAMPIAAFMLIVCGLSRLPSVH